MGYYVNGDEVSALEVKLMFGAFSGITMLALTKGGVIGSHDEAIEKSQTENVSPGQYILAMLILCLNPFFFSSVSVLTRKMKDIHFSLMMFHYGLFATIFCSVWITAEYVIQSRNGTYQPVSEDCTAIRVLCYGRHQWAILFSIGLLNASSMNFMTIAGQLEKSAFITSILQIMLVYALIIDILYFKI